MANLLELAPGDSPTFVRMMTQGMTRHKSLLALLMVLLLAPAAGFALHGTEPPRTSISKPHRNRVHRRRIRWNPLFKPSRDSLLRQNEEIDRLDLPRIQDDDQLEELKASGDLVPIIENESLKIERRLDPARRYCRSWTREFLEDFSQAYYQRFRTKIQVNSAVRTVKFQKKLRRRNRNAAPAEGETASSHLAGLTVDLQRRGMTKEQIRFVQRYLFYLHQLGLVEPLEERRHWCFHVMVSDRYSDWRRSQTVFRLSPTEQTETAMRGTN